MEDEGLPLYIGRVVSRVAGEILVRAIPVASRTIHEVFHAQP